ALDLKPNYVRAWANMGISYANQVRVPLLVINTLLCSCAWQYLRLSLSCASRQDLIEACEARNLDVLQEEPSVSSREAMRFKP
ncbi:hypothetical protein HID58_005047, partial [Brassica napus]